MTIRRQIRNALLFFALMALAGSIAAAAIPSSPFGLAVHMDQQVIGQRVSGSFSWLHISQSGAEPQGFRLYIANGVKREPTGFDLYLTESADRGDSVRRIGDSAFYAAWFDVDPGIYSFYMTAFNADGESTPSAIVVVDASPLAGTISFTTIPPDLLGGPDSLTTRASVGLPWEYDADATASNGGTVRYSLRQVPGIGLMTIDSVTGLVRYVPVVPGDVYVGIEARLVEDPRVVAVQSFRLRVTQCTPANTPIITGRVVDQNGAAAVGRITAYPVNLNGYRNAISIEVDASGSYMLFAEEGSYRVGFEGDGYVSEWYADEHDYNLATTLDISCSDTVNVDITVTKRNPAQFHMVSGRVSSKVADKPLMGYIYFTGFDRNVPDSVKWETATTVVARSDDQGQYAISLSDQYSYTAHAVVTDDTVDNMNRYATQYYNGVAEPMLATMLTLTGNLSDIDFQLNALEPHRNALMGRVRDAGGNSVTADVVAYRISSQGTGSTAEAVNSMVADRGYYNFVGLPPGNYVIFATPRNRRHTPGYHSANGNAVPTWQEATQIKVTNDPVNGMFDVVLGLRTGAKGKSVLRGIITSGSGRSLKLKDHEIAGTQPVAGAVVYAIDESNAVAGYDLTGLDGRFEIAGLGAGAFVMVVDRVGYMVHKEGATLDGSDRAEQREIRMNLLVPSSVPSGRIESSRTAAYPNPASSHIRLHVDGASGPARITVANARGEEVYAMTTESINVSNGHLLDFSGLPNGIYFVRLESGSVTRTTAVTIVR